MQTYEVRLEAPGSPQQHRIFSVGAHDEQHAKELAHAKELTICEFDLHPPDRDVWEDPHLHNSTDARVDARLWDNYDPVFAAETAKHTDYGDAKRAAKARLDMWAQRSELRDGKLRTNLGPRSKARYAAHLQTDPYEIVDVRKVPTAEIDANRLIREARQLAQNDPAKWQKVLDGLREGNVPLAAVTASLYGKPTLYRSNGTSNGAVDWHTSSSDAFHVTLSTSSYTVDLDTHDFWDDVSTNEATGTNWSAGGVTLATASLASSYDSTTDQARYDGPDVSVSTTTVTFRNIHVVRWTGTGSTSVLIAYVNAGASDVSTTAGTLGITWDTTGIWLVDVT